MTFAPQVSDTEAVPADHCHRCCPALLWGEVGQSVLPHQHSAPGSSELGCFLCMPRSWVKKEKKRKEN